MSGHNEGDVRKLAEEVKKLDFQIFHLSQILKDSITKNTTNIIESSERLAQSNEKHARSMQWLTAALIAVGLLQVFIPII